MNRGRGRGRKSAGPRPVARDDQGQIVETKTEGPPPLYPEMKNPPSIPYEELNNTDGWVKSFNALGSHWRKAFRLEMPKNGEPTLAPALEMIPLDREAGVIPEELVSRDKKKRKSESDYWANRQKRREIDRRNAMDDDFKLIEEMALKEGALGDRPTSAGRVGRPIEEENDDEEEDGDEAERERRELEADEEDDYDDAYDEAYGGYDDDEGYDDDYDGGGDEGPYY